jgi:hypothetical protein
MPAEQLECPRRHRATEADGRKRNGHCSVCGLRMIASARKSEDDAWRRLYGKPPNRLEIRQ